LAFLDPVMMPLLGLNPILAVGLVAFIVSLLITVIYRFTTNQNLMKQLKDEMKELQSEMKTLKDNPDKMMEVNRKAMETNMKYMSQSFRSTIFTMLPIILIFSWMNAHFAFVPLMPGQEFHVTLSFAKNAQGNASIAVPEGIEVVGDASKGIVSNSASFTLKGKEGTYTEGNSVKFDYNQKTFFKDVIISTDEYAKKDTVIKDDYLKTISIDYEKRKILPVLNWGWLGTYIVFSIVFSMTLRKLFKVY